MTFDIRYLSVNGARLGYQVHSDGSGKPPAIFLHGYSGRSTGDIYGTLVERLAEYFTLYALDMRGHGASASEVEGFSMGAVADDVAAFVCALGLTGALHIGHSFGGFTGMYCEVRHPGTFSALCLLNSASAEGGKDSPPDVGTVFIEGAGDVDFLTGALSPHFIRGGSSAAHIAAAMLMDRRIHELYFPEWRQLSIMDELRNIAIPVLAINGALDNVVPLATQHVTAMAIPNCKEVVFTTEGHNAPLEAPDRMAREIVAFWTHDVAAGA
ncbi:MAG: alpha/beta hydrolase [Sphingomonadales bacterium]|nr:MAG: alpha/beta hydrolase [Sphingomonadales bacterium]